MTLKYFKDIMLSHLYTATCYENIQLALFRNYLTIISNRIGSETLENIESVSSVLHAHVCVRRHSHVLNVGG